MHTPERGETPAEPGLDSGTPQLVRDMTYDEVHEGVSRLLGYKLSRNAIHFIMTWCQLKATDHGWVFNLSYAPTSPDGWTALYEMRVDEYTYANIYRGESKRDPVEACMRCWLSAMTEPLDDELLRVLRGTSDGENEE